MSAIGGQNGTGRARAASPPNATIGGSRGWRRSFKGLRNKESGRRGTLESISRGGVGIGIGIPAEAVRHAE